VFRRHEPALIVETVAVGIVAGLPESGHAFLFGPFLQFIGRDVAEDKSGDCVLSGKAMSLGHHNADAIQPERFEA